MIEREVQRMGRFTGEAFAGKVACWLLPGKCYLVRGYHTGDFIGQCLSTDRQVALFEIVDTLRPAPRIPKPKCPFPGCVLNEFHIDDHELARMRMGGKIEVFWRNAEFTCFPEAA